MSAEIPETVSVTPTEPAFPRNLDDCLRWLSECNLLGRRIEFVATAKGVDYALGGKVDFDFNGVSLSYDDSDVDLTWADLLAPDEEVIRAKEDRLRAEAEEKRRRAAAAAVLDTERRHTESIANLTRLIRQYPGDAARIMADVPPNAPPEPRNPRLRPRIGDAVSWSDVGGAGRPTVNTARVVSLCSESGGLFVASKHDGASYLWTLEQWQLDNGNTTWIPNNDSIFR